MSVPPRQSHPLALYGPSFHLYGLEDPLPEVTDFGVDAWLLGQGTTGAPAHDATQPPTRRPRDGVLTHKGTTAVTLVGEGEAWLEALSDGSRLWSEPSGPEIGSPTAHCLVPPSLEWQGQGLPHTLPHLAGINASLKVAGTEHLGLDLVPIEVRTIADIIADYGDSSLLEDPSLLAWG